jgi:hypothetical protein
LWSLVVEVVGVTSEVEEVLVVLELGLDYL